MANGCPPEKGCSLQDRLFLLWGVTAALASRRPALQTNLPIWMIYAPNPLADSTEARLTVPEAAFVSGLTVRGINREIDAGVISLGGRSEQDARG
jgi:hypothetical protein